MTERRAYIDTSAYLAVMLGEAGSAELQSALRKKNLCSSTLLLIEAERTLVRLTREKLLTIHDYHLVYNQVKKDVQLFILRDLTPDFCLKGVFPAVRIPRSSDLVHLRTALWFSKNGGLEIFISSDRSQIEAAQELGLPTQ